MARHESRRDVDAGRHVQYDFFLAGGGFLPGAFFIGMVGFIGISLLLRGACA
jgi:hypothetical protein